MIIVILVVGLKIRGSNLIGLFVGELILLNGDFDKRDGALDRSPSRILNLGFGQGNVFVFKGQPFNDIIPFVETTNGDNICSGKIVRGNNNMNNNGYIN